MTGSKVLPPSNLPPQSQPWGRDKEGQVRQDLEDVEALKTNSLSLYKQLGGAVSAASKQLQGVQNLLNALPTTQSGRLVASGFTLPANTWTTVLTRTIQVPPGRNQASIIVGANISLNIGTTNSTIWFYVSAGVNANTITAPTTSTLSTPSNEFTRIAQVSTGAEYTYPGRRGGIMTINMQLWHATGITPLSGEVSLNYSVMLGGY